VQNSQFLAKVWDVMECRHALFFIEDREGRKTALPSSVRHSIVPCRCVQFLAYFVQNSQFLAKVWDVMECRLLGPLRVGAGQQGAFSMAALELVSWLQTYSTAVRCDRGCYRVVVRCGVA
jgi:hypothetical protein